MLAMEVTFRGPVPPEHPLFSGGVGFVVRSDPPEDEHEQDVVETDDEHDTSQ